MILSEIETYQQWLHYEAARLRDLAADQRRRGLAKTYNTIDYLDGQASIYDDAGDQLDLGMPMAELERWCRGLQAGIGDLRPTEEDKGRWDAAGTIAGHVAWLVRDQSAVDTFLAIERGEFSSNDSMVGWHQETEEVEVHGRTHWHSVWVREY